MQVILVIDQAFMVFSECQMPLLKELDYTHVQILYLVP